MLFHDTPIPGVLLVEQERVEDERGFFARTFSREEFAARGLDARVDQCSTSFNPTSGTLRGLHYQAEPHGEAKLVRCTRGAVFDVALDLRRGSRSYLRSFSVELHAEAGLALFIPDGCAHGFQTLVEGTEVLYQISTPHMPGASRGVRWDDPAFAIDWPAAPAHGRTMSRRDAEYPDFDP